MKVLALSVLAAGMPGLTSAKGRVMAEAGSICLSSMGHEEPIELLVDGDYEAFFNVALLPVTEQMCRGYRFDTRATDDGACAIAILVVAELTGYEVVEEAARGSHFDYWLAPRGSFLFQASARLEISGLRQGTHDQIAARTREKMDQIDKSPHSVLPGYVVVVEFSRPMTRVIRR